MEWKAIYKYWFSKGEREWFTHKTKRFDREIKRRFEKTYWEVVRGEHADWRRSAKGALTEIIVLDQFSRNMFRGDGRAFAHDPLALALSQRAIERGFDKNMSKYEKLFLYLPFMHSESSKVQRESIKLFKSMKDKDILWFARDHQKIITTFGRYPHRNRAVGRKSTKAELKFMLKHKGY